jgi:hypothetical protein
MPQAVAIRNVTIPPQSLAATDGGTIMTFRKLSPVGGDYGGETFVLTVVDPATGIAGEPFASLVWPTMYRTWFGSSGPRFAGYPQHAVSADGHVFITHADAASIDVVSLWGESRKRLRLDSPRRAVTRDDLRAVEATVDEFMRRHYGITAEEYRRRNRADRGIPHARYMPVTGEILATRRRDLRPPPRHRPRSGAERRRSGAERRRHALAVPRTRRPPDRAREAASPLQADGRSPRCGRRHDGRQPRRAVDRALPSPKADSFGRR